MSQESIRENVLRVMENVRSAAIRSGRQESEVTIVAAAKTQPTELVLQAIEAGILHIGENRVQEAEARWSDKASRSGFTLHMIGKLQRNKVRRAVHLFDIVQSCDSLALARKLSGTAAEARKDIPVFLEVNTGGEQTKAGFSPEELQDQVGELLSLPSIEIRGLMTVAPIAPTSDEARQYFRMLRDLSQELRSEHGEIGPALSMGMTDDYEVAIEEGATVVRIGRAIFGERR